MKILELTRKEFAGGILTYQYDTFGYYAVTASSGENGFSLSLVPKNAARRHIEYSREIFAPQLLSPRLFILTDSGGERAGYLETNPSPDGRTLEVTNFMVEESFRRQGYGTLLLTRAKNQARAMRCEALRIRVHAANFDAIRFLLGQGLTLTGYTALPDAPGARPGEPTLEFGCLF